MNITIATRKSALALWQAEHVANILRALPGVSSIRLLPRSTRGDEILDRSLHKVGGKGLFIKELELAMAAGEADIAVHSMKDVPFDMPEGFCVAAVLPRANPADALLSRNHAKLAELPQAASVGSSSLRRQAQILAVRPDIQVLPLRGNVNTRLNKLDQGHFDAIVLACAGLERLGFANRISETLDPRQMLPAAGQGVIGVECRSDNAALRTLLAQVDHGATRMRISAERAVARRLGASCHSPVAAFATLEQGDQSDSEQLTIAALVAAADGSQIIREQLRGPSSNAAALGQTVAGTLLSRGADRLLAEAG